MKSRPWMIGALAALALGAAGLAAAATAGRLTAEQRVQALEDREAIRVLFNDYGRTLDARDFAGFEALFARNAEYGGGGGAKAVGPKAIRAQLETSMRTNPLNLPEPNFHIFFNESIEVRGDRATALSKSMFVAPNTTNGRAEIIFLAHYDDELVREDGRWKFARRDVRGDLPAPRKRP